MGVAKKKPATLPAKALPRPPKATEVGPDGLTFGERLAREMTFRNMGQSALARIASKIYQQAHPGVTNKVKQQHVGNAIKSGQGSSEYLSLFADALEVRCTWLQYGIPPKKS